MNLDSLRTEYDAKVDAIKDDDTYRRTFELVNEAHKHAAYLVGRANGTIETLGYRYMTFVEIEEGERMMREPGGGTKLSDSSQPDTAPIINKAGSFPGTLASCMRELVNGHAHQIAKQGGVSEKWLSYTMNGVMPGKDKLKRFLNNLHLTDEKQKPFLDAFAADGGKTKTFNTETDRILDSHTANGS